MMKGYKMKAIIKIKDLIYILKKFDLDVAPASPESQDQGVVCHIGRDEITYSLPGEIEEEE